MRLPRLLALHSPHVPQRHSVVAVVNEVHHRSDGQWQGDQGKHDAVGTSANQLLACTAAAGGEQARSEKV